MVVVEGNRAVDDGCVLGARAVLASVWTAVVTAINRVVVEQAAVRQDSSMLGDGRMGHNAGMKNGCVLGARAVLAGVWTAVVTAINRVVVEQAAVRQDSSMLGDGRNAGMKNGCVLGARAVLASVRAAVVTAFNRVVVQQAAVRQDSSMLGDGRMGNAGMKNGCVLGARAVLAGVRAAVVTAFVRHDNRVSLMYKTELTIGAAAEF